MPAIAERTLMTTEELLAMPDDGVERWLIRGQLREKKAHNCNAAGERKLDLASLKVKARITELLSNWLQSVAQPRLALLLDESGCRIEEDDSRLAVVVLCLADSYGAILARIDAFQGRGIPLIWVVDPHDQTVTIYRTGKEPELVNIRQELTGDSHLPGFRVKMAEIFA